MLLGLRGNLFRSANNGDNWEQVTTGVEASLTSGLLLSDGSLLVVGLAGTLLHSLDDGRSLELQQDTSRKGFSALAQASDGTIVAVGDFGVTKIAVMAGDINGN